MTVERAIEHAFNTRADYQAAQQRVLAAEAARRSIASESLPSVKVNADFGDIGLSPTDSHGTYSLSGAVLIPIFQGGKAHGRLLEADADLDRKSTRLNSSHIT